jgi:hypothetical protein
VGFDQRPQLADQLAVAPERQIRLDPLLQGSKPELLQLRDRWLRERLVGEVRQRRPAPQPERLAQNPRRLLLPTGSQRITAVLDQFAEAVQVKLARRDVQQVAVPTGHQRAITGTGRRVAVRPHGHSAVRGQHLAQPRHVHLQGPHRARRRRLAPQLVDQPVSRHHLVAIKHQDRQQRALLIATQRNEPTAVAELN